MLIESPMQANIQIVKSDVPYPTVASLVQDGFAPLMLGFVYMSWRLFWYICRTCNRGETLAKIW